ncbi:glycosyltransferase family 2 protein [Thermanaerothrix daxensis]|uniref:glycosyltransferase family 2 protein n=1 Tax=Thermanaerothrix daxensis TaxID=869279 RepID=UPI0006C9121D|nr:glycosyltransferase family 2 protein [Thermanaerothrix daxensis]
MHSIAELPPTLPDRKGWPWIPEESLIFPSQMPEGHKWPRISVTVPSYNQGRFLEATLRSLLLQGYPDLEIHVMDGGSTDETRWVLEEYAPWLTSWESEPDRGQSHAINKGWERSTGELIAYLNSDDYYLPGALYRVAMAWNYHPFIAVITGGVWVVNVEGELFQSRQPFLHARSPLDLSLLDISAWYLPQQSTFFVREYLDKAGRWLREDLHYTMDRELMYRICRLGQVMVLDQPLAADRFHESSKRGSQALRMYQEDAKALSYCNWGDERAKARRKKVARARRGQGHWLMGLRSRSFWSALWHQAWAIYYRPAFFWGTQLGKTLLSVWRLLGYRLRPNR